MNRKRLYCTPRSHNTNVDVDTHIVYWRIAATNIIRFSFHFSQKTLTHSHPHSTHMQRLSPAHSLSRSQRHRQPQSRFNSNQRQAERRCRYTTIIIKLLLRLLLVLASGCWPCPSRQSSESNEIPIHTEIQLAIGVTVPHTRARWAQHTSASSRTIGVVCAPCFDLLLFKFVFFDGESANTQHFDHSLDERKSSCHRHRQTCVCIRAHDAQTTYYYDSSSCLVCFAWSGELPYYMRCAVLSRARELPAKCNR